MLNKGAVRVFDNEQMNPYLYIEQGQETSWLGYDDMESLTHKVKYTLIVNVLSNISQMLSF